MKIPVINEEGEVIGSEERAIVHKEGLLHPEVFVLIKLPNGKFVFQKRSMSKETNPGLLTFSVSGHIDLGQTPEEAVVRELEEETGIKETIHNISYLGKFFYRVEDKKNNTINNSLRYNFGYHFNGQLSDLKVEPLDGDGFEEYTIEEIKNLNEEERSKFVKSIFTKEAQDLFDKFK